MIGSGSGVQPLRWVGDIQGHLEILDQTRLPGEVRYVACHDLATVCEAIRALRVRGAPLIGLAAAYGVVLAVREITDPDRCRQAVQQAADILAQTRPTAVNLFWSLDRMRCVPARQVSWKSTRELRESLLEEALRIHAEDRETCRRVGRIGAELLSDPCSVLTHCNTGGLATAEYGTALSVIYTAQDQGKRIEVYVNETRPLLQGARLTAWELRERNVPMTLICDSMAAYVMQQGRVQVVLTGADRIAANGDVANKIGTYGLAVLAQAHGLPFYVVAPCSTFDPSLTSGDRIPIEERGPEEVVRGFVGPIAPEGTRVYNPAFDITPADRITAIITEKGIIQPVNKASIAKLLSS